MIMRMPNPTPNGPAPAADPGTVWVEVVCRYTPFGTGQFRGRTSREELERLYAGQPQPFLRLLDCYWYNEPDCEDEPWTPLGDFTRLWTGVYRNFTGELMIRADTIHNVAVLKSGIDGEPSDL
jgi:hypothetical protein